MRPLFAAVAAALLFAPLAADAHGPSRQKVTETIEISAPPEKVWARVGEFDDMSWLPPIAATEAPKGNEIGAIRVLHVETPDGPTVTEELTKYDAAKRSYSYRITEVDVKVLPVTNYSSTITVKDGANGGSLVEWRGAFYRGFPNNDPPPELNDEASAKAVTDLYKTGLGALKTELEATN